MLLSHQFFLSIIGCFKVLSYNKLITLIQSFNLVYLIVNFDMYSIVIQIAIEVNIAMLDNITTPMLG